MDSQTARLRQPFHRDNRELPSESQLLAQQLSALRRMGITDKYEILHALNVGEHEDARYRVRQLDRMYNIYHMFTHGIPNGMFAEVVKPIACPKCGNEVYIVPCVHCLAKGHFKTTLEDHVPDWDD